MLIACRGRLRWIKNAEWEKSVRGNWGNAFWMGTVHFQSHRPSDFIRPLCARKGNLFPPNYVSLWQIGSRILPSHSSRLSWLFAQMRHCLRRGLFIAPIRTLPPFSTPTPKSIPQPRKWDWEFRGGKINQTESYRCRDGGAGYHVLFYKGVRTW